MQHKVGRNDPCPCGSGKKYKKCCEEKLKSKKFHAELLQGGIEKEGTVEKVSKANTFFQKHVAPTTILKSSQDTQKGDDEEKNPVM